jgi:hypothetical protein
VVNAQARLNAALRALANNDGSNLTGITADQVGALDPSGDGSALTGITATQVGALEPTGDGSELTGITATQVGAIADGDTVTALTIETLTTPQINLLDTESDHYAFISLRDDLTQNRSLGIQINDGNRTVNLSGNLTVPAAATISGTNTGDVTLAGTPDYLTISGQTITRNAVDLASDITGTLPIANGGTGQTSQTAAFDALAPTTTKGDLIVHNGSDNVRVPVGGTNGHVLTVDSAEATGVKWAAGGIGGSTGATNNRILLSDGTGGSTLKASTATFDSQTLTTAGALTLVSGNGGTVNLNFNVFFSSPNVSLGNINNPWARLGVAQAGITIGTLGGSPPSITASGTSPNERLNLYPSPAGTGIITAGTPMAFSQVATPAVPPTNSAQIYSKDVSGTAEMFVMDEAGNETQISPHAAQHAPDSMVDSAWDEVGYSANYYTGVIVWTNRTREANKAANARGYESFEEYNTRRGLTGDAAMQMWDWDTVQDEHVAKSVEAHDAWLERKAKAKADKVDFSEAEPEIIVAKSIPDFLAEQINGRAAFLAERSSRKKLYPEAEMYQIHDWMHDNGLDPEAVPQIIAAAFPAGVERKKALSRWNKAVRVPRDHALVNVIGARMNPPLTPQQIDAAWPEILTL